MTTDQANGSASLESTEQRARELAEAIERAHASDRRRIQSGEIKQEDLCVISEELARSAKVSWPRSYRIK